MIIDLYPPINKGENPVVRVTIGFDEAGSLLRQLDAAIYRVEGEVDFDETDLNKLRSLRGGISDALKRRVAVEDAVARLPK